MFRSIGWQELAIVLVIVLLLFGPKRLPQLGKMFGKTMRNVRDGIEGKLEDEDTDNELTEGKMDTPSRTAEESKDKEPASKTPAS